MSGIDIARWKATYPILHVASPQWAYTAAFDIGDGVSGSVWCIPDTEMCGVLVTDTPRDDVRSHVLLLAALNDPSPATIEPVLEMFMAMADHTWEDDAFSIPELLEQAKRDGILLPEGRRWKSVPMRLNGATARVVVDAMGNLRLSVLADEDDELDAEEDRAPWNDPVFAALDSAPVCFGDLYFNSSNSRALHDVLAHLRRRA